MAERRAVHGEPGDAVDGRGAKEQVSGLGCLLYLLGLLGTINKVCGRGQEACGVPIRVADQGAGVVAKVGGQRGEDGVKVRGRGLAEGVLGSAAVVPPAQCPQLGDGVVVGERVGLVHGGLDVEGERAVKGGHCTLIART